MSSGVESSPWAARALENGAPDIAGVYCDVQVRNDEILGLGRNDDFATASTPSEDPHHMPFPLLPPYGDLYDSAFAPAEEHLTETHALPSSTDSDMCPALGTDRERRIDKASDLLI